MTMRLGHDYAEATTHYFRQCRRVYQAAKLQGGQLFGQVPDAM
jgi:hypothetical protein